MARGPPPCGPARLLRPLPAPPRLALGPRLGPSGPDRAACALRPALGSPALAGRPQGHGCRRALAAGAAGAAFPTGGGGAGRRGTARHWLSLRVAHGAEAPGPRREMICGLGSPLHFCESLAGLLACCLGSGDEQAGRDCIGAVPTPLAGAVARQVPRMHHDRRQRGGQGAPPKGRNTPPRPASQWPRTPSSTAAGPTAASSSTSLGPSRCTSTT